MENIGRTWVADIIDWVNVKDGLEAMLTGSGGLIQMLPVLDPQTMMPPACRTPRVGPPS
jgi:hypothetical protein